MDTTDQYFDYLCRTCMNELEATPQDSKTKPLEQWQSIFDMIEEEGIAYGIAELLTNAIPQIEVQLSDELPKRICSKCLQQLLGVYRFQQMCVKSEQQMRQQVSKRQTDLSIPAAPIKFETKDADSFPGIDELLKHCNHPQDNISEIVKNEPIEDNESSVERSDYDTIHSIVSVKEEVLAENSEEQQKNENENVKAHHIILDEDKSYKCPYCPRRFSLKRYMLQHKAIHKRAKRVTCNICGKSIMKSNLKEHKLTHDDQKPYKCDLCEKSFAKLNNLRVHIRKHTGEKPYKCKYCERSFSQSSACTKHMHVHVGDNIHRCELCPLGFPVASELRVHLTTHENEDPETRERNMKALKEAEAMLEIKKAKKIEDAPYECPHCSRRFRTKSRMLQHKANHEGGKRETCDICGKSMRKRHLKEHKLIHSDQKPHKCDHCEMSFAKNFNLRVHIRKHTGEKPYKCKYCERSFSQSSACTKHMHVHVGDNIHRCELCPLGFPVASELRVHLTTHENEDPETRERNMKALKEAEAMLEIKKAKKIVDDRYEFPHCSRIFRTKSRMLQHKANHEGDKRETCDICGKSMRKCNLKEHKLIHSDQKPHKCDHCEVSFAKISNLRDHIRTHTGEKPYKCKYCDRSFSQSSERIRHMRRAHLGDNVYRCELCPLAFRLVSELRVHFTTHKNDDPDTHEQNMKALKEAEAKLPLKPSKNLNKYECPYCPRRFSTNSVMHRHKAMHEGNERETCDVCGKDIIKRHLKQHKLNHSNEKPHKCDFCEMSFAQRYSLNAHVRKHTGDKPYKCKYCDRSFAQCNWRTRHMRVHLGDNIYRCELCPLAFPLLSEVRAHFLTHKNEDPETRERNMKALKEAEAKLQQNFEIKDKE